MDRSLPAWTASTLLLASFGVSIAARAGELPTFIGLGDLPGGPFNSIALGVSRDGSAVVGQSRSSDDASSTEAFLWTESDGMIGLGDLGPGSPRSTARAVSAGGQVVVGRCRRVTGGIDRVPFRWTQATGIELLADSVGFEPRGDAHDLSANGDIIVGSWVSPSGTKPSATRRRLASSGSAGSPRLSPTASPSGPPPTACSAAATSSAASSTPSPGAFRATAQR